MSIYSKAQLSEDDRKMVDQFTSEIIDYWVSRGYDSDELVALGSRKSIEFLVQVAQYSPNLDNEIFGIHTRAFIASLSSIA